MRTDSRATPFTRAESGKQTTSVPGGTPFTLTYITERSVWVRKTGDLRTTFFRSVVVRTSRSVVTGGSVVTLGSSSLMEAAVWEISEGGCELGRGVDVTRETAGRGGDSGKDEADMKVLFWAI